MNESAIFGDIVAALRSGNPVEAERLSRDILAQAPTHIVIVPKKAIPRIAEAEEDDQALLGHLMLKAAVVAEELGLVGVALTLAG